MKLPDEDSVAWLESASEFKSRVAATNDASELKLMLARLHTEFMETKAALQASERKGSFQTAISSFYEAEVKRGPFVQRLEAYNNAIQMVQPFVCFCCF